MVWMEWTLLRSWKSFLGGAAEKQCHVQLTCHKLCDWSICGSGDSSDATKGDSSGATTGDSSDAALYKVTWLGRGKTVRYGHKQEEKKVLISYNKILLRHVASLFPKGFALINVQPVGKSTGSPVSTLALHWSCKNCLLNLKSYNVSCCCDADNATILE